jgi:hypothetical protein
MIQDNNYSDKGDHRPMHVCRDMANEIERLANAHPKNANTIYSGYFKNIYLKKILSTPPVTCESNSSSEIHILTCHRDLLETLWCLKTFYHFSKLNLGLVIHDDGTLSPADITIFHNHFVNCRLVRKKEADEKLSSALKNTPFSFRCRFQDFLLLSMKLFDPFFFSGADNILLLDSDVLFFNKPSEVMDCCANSMPCFMDDYQNAYSLLISDLNKVVDKKVIDRFNSGLLCYQRKKIDLETVEKLLKSVLCNKNFDNTGWIEQTIFALLFSLLEDPPIRLSENYQISFKTLTEDTISHHYVNDGSRVNFYIQGLRRLALHGFLEQL